MNIMILGIFAVIGIVMGFILKMVSIRMFHSVNWYWRWQVHRQDRQQRSEHRQSPEEYIALSTFVWSCLRTQSLNVMDWDNMYIYKSDENLMTALNKRCHQEVCRSVQQAFAVNWLQDHRTLVSRQCG